MAQNKPNLAGNSMPGVDVANINGHQLMRCKAIAQYYPKRYFG